MVSPQPSGISILRSLGSIRQEATASRMTTGDSAVRHGLQLTVPRIVAVVPVNTAHLVAKSSSDCRVTTKYSSFILHGLLVILRHNVTPVSCDHIPLPREE